MSVKNLLKNSNKNVKKKHFPVLLVASSPIYIVKYNLKKSYRHQLAENYTH